MPGVGQIGIYTPLDPSVFLRHDGSVALSAIWNAGFRISADYFLAIAGGNVFLGEAATTLRITRETGETIKILGESDNEAELLQKNATMTDLSGVGVRAVMADVNGKLSAP